MQHPFHVLKITDSYLYNPQNLVDVCSSSAKALKIMAHRSRDRNFGYPPVPSVYTNSVSTFGGLQGTAPMRDREPETSRSPYYGHDATTYSTPSPYASSYQDNVDENAPTQNAPVIPPALSSDYSHLAPHKSVETKGAGFHAHNNNKNTDAKSVTEIQRNQRDEKDRDAGHNGSFESISTTNVMVRSQGSSKANSTSKSAFHQWPQGTQPYVPRGPDTSEDHANFGCDLCPVIVARRDILQIHKAQFHGMTESPFVPESGSVDMPPYLKGVTLESCSKHSRHALRIFNGGALSSSPCQPCKSRGLDCIVNPFLSSLCVRCSYYDNGSYCGAAGVKYRYVSSGTLSPDSLR